MLILDTNVVSALMRPEMNEVVVAWVDRQPASLIWSTSICLMEIWTGLHLMPAGRRKKALSEGFAQLRHGLLSDRILAFDAAAAEEGAAVAAHQLGRGVNADIGDYQIAGIARARHATLATRNIRDFDDLGITLVDPWSD